MKIAGWLQQLDESVFNVINVDSAPLWLDKLMMTLRYPITWVPLYVILLIIFYKKSPRYFVALLLTTIVTFALTDYISASVLKPLFERLRPCHEEELSITVRHVVACGGKYSMPSSHASNHFGLAMCWFNIALLLYRQKWYWVWGWASAICYAQVYVGVHYPLDILVGATLGMLIGFCTFSLFKKWYHLKESNNKKAFHFT